MSVHVMKQVWKNGLTDRAERLLLLALADNADDEGFCFPSQALMAEKALMSDRQVRRVLLKLEGKGYLETISSGGGRKRPNVYKVIPNPDITTSTFNDENPDISDTVNPDISDKTRTSETLNPDISSTNPDIAMSDEPSSATIKEPSSRTTTSREAWEAEFADWYSRYPRKVGRGQAERAFKAARKIVDMQELLDSTETYAESVMGKDPKYIPHPSTWLNGKRWLDAPEHETRPETYSEELRRRLGGSVENIFSLEDRR